MRGLLAVGLIGCLAVAALGCGEGAGAPKPAPPAATWDGRGFARHVDGPAGLAFDLPAAGYHVATERFPRTTPPRKIKDIVTLTGPQGVAVTVDVWHDPEGLALAAWFERHLAFMRTPDALVGDGTATAARVPAILVAQPRSEQAAGRDAAVFAVGGRVFRVTCHDRDDARSQAAYARLLATFVPEARP
jgi:hypothetical protein